MIENIENIENIMFYRLDEVGGFELLSLSIDSGRRRRGAVSYEKTLYICNGSIPITNSTVENVTSCFESFNEVLRIAQCRVLVMRNNNSDPTYFKEKRIVFSNIETVEDYTVVEAANKKLLLVGGSVSPNRAWKIKQEELINKYLPEGARYRKLYFEDEEVKYDEETLDAIIKDNKDICSVVFTAPPFNVKNGAVFEPKAWFKNNKELKKSFSNQRETLGKIVSKLSESYDGKLLVIANGNGLTPFKPNEVDFYIEAVCERCLLSLSKMEEESLKKKDENNFGWEVKLSDLYDERTITTTRFNVEDYAFDGPAF